MEIALRLAVRSDLPALEALAARAIDQLQAAFLDDAQIAASRVLMGLDTQLVDDGTYFIAEIGGVLAGCGGWGMRATLSGGDHSPGRSMALLDPARDAARIRAMYTAPGFARCGVARAILERSEQAAAEAGFTALELAGTLAGEPLYAACGYVVVKRWMDDRAGAPVPLLLMRKVLAITE